MLSFVDHAQGRGHRLNRREWLRIGSLATLGGLLPLQNLQADGATTEGPHYAGFGKAKSVIVIFTSGGQSQIDMWDPKPEAPAEIRGAFASIPTRVPELRICEHLPRVAKIMDRCTLIRCLSHEDLDHGSAVYLSLTGHYHNRRSSNPPPTETDYPAFTGILKRVRPQSEFVQPAVHINGPAIIAPNNIAPGQFGGLLGREYDALTVGDVTQGTLVIPGLAPNAELPKVRIRDRQQLLAAIDQHRSQWSHSTRMRDMGTIYQQAFEMLENPRTRNAFDLSEEPLKLRERYGLDRSGQACLLARRLVQAGVPLVNVIWNHHSRGQDHEPQKSDSYGWDTHNDIFEALGGHLLPRFDQSFSALIEDLAQHGLLEDTLVLCFGEFGRAPLVAYEKGFLGQTPGRKHWAAVYSAIAAGAGVQQGKILGASDKQGAYPVGERYGPWDLTATIFSALGIDPASHYTDATGRPYKISEGRPIAGLYS